MASFLGLELHHPIVIMVWGDGVRSKRKKEIKKERNKERKK